MKIVNISHVYFPDQNDPLKWIERSRFFKGIWEAVAGMDEVIFVEFMNYTGKLKHNGVSYWFQKRSGNALRFPLDIHRAIAREKPDVVVVHGLHFPLQVMMLSAVLGRKCKIVVQDHGGSILRHPVKKYLQRLADRCIDAYFFTSVQQAKIYLDRKIIRDMEKIHEVVEISSVFAPEERSLARSVTKISGTNTYIWVGHLNANKDPMLVVKAFTQLIASGADVALYMIFQSEELLPEIKAWLSHHANEADRIHLVGRVVHEEVQHWFSSADFIISSSHREAGGVSICEGMSCGCIPVLSNIPSFKAMTGNECGILYETGNEVSLLHALQASLHLDKSIEKEKVLKRFRQHLSFEAIANNIQEILHHL